MKVAILEWRTIFSGWRASLVAFLDKQSLELKRSNILHRDNKMAFVSVDLTTGSGLFIQAVEIPHFGIMPEVIIARTRTFRRLPNEPVTTYREVFAYVLPPGAVLRVSGTTDGKITMR